MEILREIIFLFAWVLSFLTYRLGITDGLGIRENRLPEIRGLRREQHIPGKEEKDFLNQYSELMNYSFDKVGEVSE